MLLGKELICCSTSSKVPALRASPGPHSGRWGPSVATTSEETGLGGVSLFQRSLGEIAITAYTSRKTEI